MAMRDIERFVSSRAVETLQLDFKTVNQPEFSKEDKANLAKALSGYANSAGGLIVWGVVAKKNEDDIDCAFDLKEIPKVDIFGSRLVELSGEGVMPRLDRVLHRVFRRRSTGAGFAVTLVPESEGGPHMAKLAENRYYKRSGTSFVVMEHFDIADMMGRRPRPQLTLAFSVLNPGNEPEIIVGIANSGKGSASAPYLALKIREGPFKHDGLHGLNGNGHFGMAKIMVPSSGFEAAFGEGTDFVVHAGRTLYVTKYRLPFQNNLPITRDVEINYLLCAENVPLTEGTLAIPLGSLFPK